MLVAEEGDDWGDMGESGVTTPGDCGVRNSGESGRDDGLTSVMEVEKSGFTASRSGFRGGGTSVAVLLLRFSPILITSANSGSFRKAG